MPLKLLNLAANLRGILCSGFAKLDFVFVCNHQIELVWADKNKRVFLFNISGMRKEIARLPSRGADQLSLVRVDRSELQSLVLIKSRCCLIIILSAILGLMLGFALALVWGFLKRSHLPALVHGEAKP